jgi:hypothetical protein
MLRIITLSEAAAAFALAATATAALPAVVLARRLPDIPLAVALGGITGAAVFAIAAPALDRALGRGRLLTLSLAGAGAAPLVIASSGRVLDPVLLLAACAIAAFALSSAPQRYALTYDLATSTGRLRIACDLQALKLVGAALGPLGFVAVERAAPGLGLVVASAVAFVALAIFAPTLGSLGRPAS